MPNAAFAPAPQSAGRSVPEDFIPIALDGSPRYQHQHTSQFLPLRHRHALLSLEGLLIDANGNPVSATDATLIQQVPPVYSFPVEAVDPAL